MDGIKQHSRKLDYVPSNQRHGGLEVKCRPSVFPRRIPLRLPYAAATVVMLLSFFLLPQKLVAAIFVIAGGAAICFGIGFFLLPPVQLLASRNRPATRLSSEETSPETKR